MDPRELVRLSLFIGSVICAAGAVYALWIGDDIRELSCLIGALAAYILRLAERINILEEKLNDKED